MSFFQRSFLIRSSALIALTLGCTSPAVIGCGGGDDDVAPGDDTGTDGDVDSSVTEGGVDSGKDASDVGTDAKDSAVDSGTDSGTDAKDSGVDAADTRPDAVDAADTAVADSGVDATDTAVADTGTADTGGTDTTAVDTAPVDTSCGAAGSACAGGKICQASGLCGDCTTDAECGAATTGTLCFAGTCTVATCHPKTDATNCSGGGGVNCCAKATAGDCIAPVSGKTTCCDDSDCAGLTGTTSCDSASNTCICPAPTPGQLFVSTTGSDVTGNGSSSCPFATIQTAVDTIAAAPPAGASSITLKHSGAPAVYTPAAQVVIPATIANGITIQGDGTSSDVKVVGPATAAWVFNSAAPGTSFTNLTVQATNTASPGGGIQVNAAAATTEGSFTSMVVLGVGGPAPTNDGIRIKGGASPQIGPGVTISGGRNGIQVTDSATGTASHVRIVSATGAQVNISGTTTACIQVDTTSPTTAVPYITVSSTGGASAPTHLTDCGTYGILSNLASAPPGNGIFDVLIDRTATGALFTGIRLQGNSPTTMSDVSISGVGPGAVGFPGIQVEGVTPLSITGNVFSTGNNRGVYVTGNAIANITGLTASNNTGSANSDGFKCDSVSPVSGATVTLRNSTFLGNEGKGAFFQGSCVGDLGSSSAAGNNTYNQTGSKNTGTGLCYLTTTTAAGIDATPFTSIWSCTTPTGTVTSTPTQASPVALCLNGEDFGNRAAGVTGRASMVTGQTCK